MKKWQRLAFLILAAIPFSLLAQQSSEGTLEELERASKEHMRDELGVNAITIPQIQKLFLELENFQPLPLVLLAEDNRATTFSTRFQNAMHFGILVADGFVVVINKRLTDIEDIGRALIRQARNLGVGESLSKRSKSLFDLSEKNDWDGLRYELIHTQADVENAMMELKDEEIAHLISLGGWLRGFQFAVTATAEDYTIARATNLAKPEIIEYFINRLDTLHPRLKRTEFMISLTSKLKTALAIILQAKEHIPTLSDVQSLRTLAQEMIKTTLSKIDHEGHVLNTPP